MRVDLSTVLVLLAAIMLVLGLVCEALGNKRGYKTGLIEGHKAEKAQASVRMEAQILESFNLGKLHGASMMTPERDAKGRFIKQTL